MFYELVTVYNPQRINNINLSCYGQRLIGVFQLLNCSDFPVGHVVSI